MADKMAAPKDNTPAISACDAQFTADQNACDKAIPGADAESTRRNSACHGSAQRAYWKCLDKATGAGLIVSIGDAKVDVSPSRRED